jgi:hypothetical protein
MTGLSEIHNRVREIGYFRYIAGCLVTGLAVYVLVCGGLLVGDTLGVDLR